MNNHNGVDDNVNQKHIFNNEEMETKMREIAENENITFLKTLIKLLIISKKIDLLQKYM